LRTRSQQEFYRRHDVNLVAPRTSPWRGLRRKPHCHGHAKRMAPRGRAGDRRLALRRVSRFNTRMSDTRIDFSAPAELRKWPSLNKQRVSASLGARPYLIGDCVTLDECIAWFMLLPESQRHLYEIHTAPQADLVTAILSTEHIVELAHLRDSLGK
jgi:hypothetical protein